MEWHILWVDGLNPARHIELAFESENFEIGNSFMTVTTQYVLVILDGELFLYFDMGAAAEFWDIAGHDWLTPYHRVYHVIRLG